MRYSFIQILAIVAAVTLAGQVPARAVSLIGYADSLSAAGAAGWACQADGTGPVSVAAYAGNVLLGVYPSAISRPDVNYLCPGPYLRGFSIAFDPATQAQFAWQPQLSLYEIAAGATPRLLPGSSRTVTDPWALPVGAVQRVDANGLVEGTVQATGLPPLVQLFAGGPLGEGVGGGWSVPTASGVNQFTFHLPAPGLMVPPGGLLPVFGSTTDARGASLPLTSPMALVAGAGGGAPQPSAIVPLAGRIAQQGDVSGITLSLLTAWLPAGQAFGGLIGLVGLTGNDPTFSEAYVLLGTQDVGADSCARENNQSVKAPPGIHRLWAGILKTNGTREVTIPANFALPYAVLPPAQGTCVVALVSAGYAVLDANPARYTSTRIRLFVQAVVPPPGAPTVVPFGIGGEFRFPVSGSPVGVYVGLQATRALAVDAIAGAASAAPVVGADPLTGWQPAPAGAWSVNTQFVFLPAAVCAAAHFNTQPPNGDFAVLRMAKPQALTIPGGATMLMRLPMQSLATQAVQRSTYKAFVPGSLPNGFSGTLAPGDCLVAYNFATGAPGVLDVENQSTVYLREEK